MDPLGITGGIRNRPAGGWSTREEELGEGSCRNTITNPPASRRAEVGGPRGAWSQLSEEARDELDARVAASGSASRVGTDGRTKDDRENPLIPNLEPRAAAQCLRGAMSARWADVAALTH